MLFSDRLQYLRNEKGINEKELSDATGISESVIRLYEKGKLHVELEHLQKLANVFEVTPKLLLGTMFPDLPPDAALDSYRLVQELVETREREKEEEKNNLPSAEEPAHGQEAFPADTANDGRQASRDGYLRAGKVALFSRIRAEKVFDSGDIEDHWPIYGSIGSLYGNDLINYYYMRVRDDCMAPTVQAQSVVLVKMNLAINSNDLAIVISQQGDAMLRRVSMYDDKIVLICDNTAYPSEVHNVSEYRILGKVLWKTESI